MQKRIVRKLDLERFLFQVEPHPSPRSKLEQYTTPVDVAATMLHIAAYTSNGIVGKTILELGCGTGRLALGAAFLGAKKVIGVDVDKVAIEVAVNNSVKTELNDKVEWVVADVDAVCGSFDTVLQNPPFGVQRREADRKFLKKALEVGNVVYSLHKNPIGDKALAKRLKVCSASTEEVRPSLFLQRFIGKCGGRVRGVYAMVFAIPHMFDFHTKRKYEFVVNLYIIEKI